MQARPLGKVSVPAAGTPVPVTADTTIFAQSIIFSAVAGSGRIFVGNSTLNKATGVGVMSEINPTPANGIIDRFEIEAEDGNLLRVAGFYVDGTANGDSVYVTYLQR